MFGATGGGIGSTGSAPFLPPSTSTTISFGTPNPAAIASPISFGAPATNPISFGAANPPSTTLGAPSFGTTTPANPISFGTPAAPTATTNPISFGGATANPTPFGAATPATTASSAAPSLFLGATPAQPAAAAASLFSTPAQPTTAAPPLFSSTTTPATSTGITAAPLFPSAPVQNATPSASGLGLALPSANATFALPKTTAQSLFSLTPTPGTTTAPILGAGLTTATPTSVTGLGGESTIDAGKITDMHSLENQIHKLVKQTERQSISFREMVRDVNSLDTVIRSNADKLKEGTNRIEAFDKRATNLDYGIAFVNDQLSNLESQIDGMEKQLRLPTWTGDWTGKATFGEANIRTAADEKRRQILQLLLALDASLKNTTTEANDAQRDVSSVALQMQGGQKDDEKALALILCKHLDMLNWIDKMNGDIEKKLTALERNL